GRALVSRGDFDDALKAFEQSEKAGYNASQVRLQKAGIYRLKGDVSEARKQLSALQELANHNAEYHFQLGSCHLAEGDRQGAVKLFEMILGVVVGQLLKRRQLLARLAH